MGFERTRPVAGSRLQQQMQAVVDERMVHERRRQIEDLATKVMSLEAERREARSELRATESKHEAVVADAKSQLAGVEAEHTELKQDVARMQQELNLHHANSQSEQRIRTLEAEALQLSELRESHEMQIEQSRREVLDLRRRLEELAVRRAQVQQETGNAADATRSLATSLEDAKRQLQESEEQRWVLRRRYQTIGEQFEKALAQSEEQSHKVRAELEASLTEHRSQANEQRQRLQAAELQLAQTELAVKETSITLQLREEEVCQWQRSLESERKLGARRVAWQQQLAEETQMKPAMVPVPLHEKLLEDQARFFQERLADLEKRFSTSQPPPKQSVRELTAELAEVRALQEQAEARHAAAEQKRCVLAESLAEAGSNISRLQQIVDEERRSAANLRMEASAFEAPPAPSEGHRLRAATAEREASLERRRSQLEAQQAVLRTLAADSSALMSAHQAQLDKKSAADAEAAELERELQMNVAEAARMALLRDRLGQLLVGPIAELRVDLQKLRCDAMEEVREFQSFCDRRTAAVAKRLQDWQEMRSLQKEILHAECESQVMERDLAQCRSQLASCESRCAVLRSAQQSKALLTSRLVTAAAEALPPSPGLEKLKARFTADGVLGDPAEALSELKKELDLGFLNAAVVAGEEETAALRAAEVAAASAAAARWAEEEAEATGELTDLEARQARLSGELRRRREEHRRRSAQRTRRKAELQQEAEHQEELLSRATEAAQSERAAAARLSEELRQAQQPPDAAAIAAAVEDASGHLRSQLQSLLAEVARLQQRFASQAETIEEASRESEQRSLAAAESEAASETLALEGEVRAARAHVVAAELAEESAARSAQQRTDLLKRRVAQGHAELAAAQQDKRRVEAECESVAKQEELSLSALHQAEQRLRDAEESQASELDAMRAERSQALRRHEEQLEGLRRRRDATEQERSLLQHSISSIANVGEDVDVSVSRHASPAGNTAEQTSTP